MSDEGIVSFSSEVCSVCGALVHPAQEELHRRWHVRLRESLGAIAAELLATPSHRRGQIPARY